MIVNAFAPTSSLIPALNKRVIWFKSSDSPYDKSLSIKMLHRFLEFDIPRCTRHLLLLPVHRCVQNRVATQMMIRGRAQITFQCSTVQSLRPTVFGYCNHSSI